MAGKPRPLGASLRPQERAPRADLKKRIGALRGFGKMTITGFGSVLALRCGVPHSQELVPEYPCLGGVDSPKALAEYKAAKRAHRATQRQLTQSSPT